MNVFHKKINTGECNKTLSGIASKFLFISLRRKLNHLIHILIALRMCLKSQIGN